MIAYGRDGLLFERAQQIAAQNMAAAADGSLLFKDRPGNKRVGVFAKPHLAAYGINEEFSVEMRRLVRALDQQESLFVFE
jgi:hypothetical protein